VLFAENNKKPAKIINMERGKSSS